MKGPKMSDQSRRNFIRTASLGAAAVGVAAVIPAGADAAGAAVPTGPTHDGPFVAWVKNPGSGDISVMAGEHEVIHHDPKLARQLAILAARAAK
jgi:hypothetical protein